MEVNGLGGGNGIKNRGVFGVVMEGWFVVGRGFGLD